MRALLLLLFGLLPACRAKNALLSLLGREWSVAPSARLHPVVLWGIGRLRIGSGCHIGPGNVLRDLVLVDLAEESVIGQFNWITAEARYAEQADPGAAGGLVLEYGAAIASRHYLDCSGGLRLGTMSILAGVRTTVLTHWAEHTNWVLRAAPVVVEKYCIVSSASTLTAGARVPEGSIVAAGAVVAKELPEPSRLYGGVPAKVIGDLSGSAHAARSEPRFRSRDDHRIASPAAQTRSTPR